MSERPDLDYPGDVEDDAEYEGLKRRLDLASAIRSGKRNLNKARARIAEVEAEAQEAADEDTRYRARERDRAAHVAWAKTPEAQETAARAKMIGLFDPVPPDAGPQCPAAGPADPDPYGRGPTRHRRPAAGPTGPARGRTSRTAARLASGVGAGGGAYE